jgi:hypothetical protein
MSRPRCPEEPKSSDSGKRARSVWDTEGFVSPAQLAESLGCSERTVREHCKKKRYPEGYQTGGGHWRLRLPLALSTRVRLHHVAFGWSTKGPFKFAEGDFDPDFAERLLMEQIYGCDVYDKGLTPYDLNIMFGHGEEPLGSQEQVAQQMMALISKMQSQGESFHKMIMLGLVFKFYETKQRFPTVGEMASVLGISRGAYYRRYSPEDLPLACERVVGLSGVMLSPDSPLPAKKINTSVNPPRRR